MAYLIKGAALVNEGDISCQDVLVEGERIARIDPEIPASAATTVINGEGCYLLPGMIDDQVHFREPGLTHKGEIATESAAAVAGGITSFMEMPNVNPPTTTNEALRQKFGRASERSLANYSFYLGATNDNIEEIKRIDPRHTCGLKVFMGASTGNMLVDDPGVLEDIFQHAPLLIATHCEDTPLIKDNEARWYEQYGNDIPISAHPLIRSEEACYRSSSYAVSLARRFGTRLHVLHLTTARELALFDSGPLAHKHVTAEACVHHLFFNENDYAQRGNLIKCNPSIKTAADQQGLLEAVQQGRIDVIATDHAPHTWKEKNQPYRNAPAGLPLVQHALPSLFEQVYRGRFDLTTVVEKTAHAPARLYQVSERGFLREGYYADLVLVDMHKAQTARHRDCLYKCGWTPFDGITLHGSVEATFVNGELKYQHGNILARTPGKALVFAR